MKSIKLKWFEPYKVAEVSSVLRDSVLFNDEKYSTLNNHGFYVYYDEKTPLPPKYNGQAYGKNANALAKRIRWETVKEISKFSEKYRNKKVDKLSLTLKVGHIFEPSIADDSPLLMNDIELALIFQMQSTMNDHGRKRYRRESIKIFNECEYFPFPPYFNLP
jgi:hypothetical protein